MCVAVTLDPGANPTLDELIKMDKANSDGVGIAWCDHDGVHWWKTTKVNPEEVLDVLKLVAESPRLLHFRYATAGVHFQNTIASGPLDELCHPFDISDRSVCTPQGVTRKAMIHNGHWGRWSEIAKLMDAEGLLPDKGPWSDTRLVSFLASVNEDWLLALGGRVATLDDTGDILRIGDWEQLRPGIHVSNKHWEYVQTRRSSTHYHGRSWVDAVEEYYADDNTPATKEPAKEHHGKKSKGSSSTKEDRELVDFLKRNPNAWFNKQKQQWCFWDEKTRDVVFFAPGSRQG